MAVTEEWLTLASDEEYMNANQLAFFRDRLLKLRGESLLTIEATQHSLVQRPELDDSAELAQYEEESWLTLRIIEREAKLVKKIDSALARIRRGAYGYCLASGEPIGIQRLLARPTAEYCAEVKTQIEEQEKHYGKR
ncbi:TraR/DksA C4-type zinc finger protein [Marinimicrobium locisalis]|uniref:TraR/DksA C4-type zinc finger protein n=1 Tax=Marinimicrobium locisalis TaxID=546022 RepID=UPI003221B5B7